MWTRASIGLTCGLQDFDHYMQPYLSESAGWTIGEDYREIAGLGPIQDTDADAAINDAEQ